MPTHNKLDTDAAYKVEGYEGVAWRFLGYVKVRDEGYEWSGIEYDDPQFVNMVMIGDDRVFTFDIDEIEQIPDDAYCMICGQIGCTHDGR